MVKFSYICAVTSSLAVPCVAAPPESFPAKRFSFSFEEWARGIVDDPTAIHLSPADAIAAHNATALTKRAADNDVKCLKGRICYVPDAVECINYLARKGQTACRAESSEGGIAFFCNAPQCKLIGESIPGGTSTSAPCNDIAITAGRIMDSCTHGNNVQGQRLVTSQPNLGLILEN